MSLSGKLSEDCRLMRESSPIVHNITNYVAMNISANALLAVGASPIMSSEPREAAELSALSSSLVINLGCLETTQIEAMEIAASEALDRKKPWVLDPVGAGATKLRTDTAARLVRDFHPSVIRGNASEIIALASASGKADAYTGTHGVDASSDSSKAVGCALELAARYDTVVCVSGPTDYVTDGNKVVEIKGGSPMMSRVTAMGCVSTALVAAFLAVDDDAVSAASCSMSLMAQAGSRAAANCSGPGTFASAFVDALYGISNDR